MRVEAQAMKQPVAAPRTPSPQVMQAKGIIQRVMVAVPNDVALNGGNGVSVVWKQRQDQQLPHVTVSHGAKGLDNRANVTNIHYKTFDNTYYHWDDTNGSTTLTFRGGAPSKGIYDETQRWATKLGLTLQKPQSVVDREAELALQAAQQAEAARLAEEARQAEEALRIEAARRAEEAELAWQAEQERRAQEERDRLAQLATLEAAKKVPMAENWEDL
jgi:hypothetical protein